MTSWIDTREVQSERANLTILFDKYLPPILDTLRVRFKKIIPIPGKKLEIFFSSIKPFFRGLVKILPLLQRAGNNYSRPWVHAAMCDNTYIEICMKIHGDSCFNLVKSTNRYQLHMTVHHTTRAYHGTIASKGLFMLGPWNKR